VRPPFLSFLISVVYRIAGRNFLAWRLLDSLILATALSLACALGWDLFGGLVAIFSSILMLASATYLDSARDGFLTEPLALLLLVLLLRTVNALFRRPLLRYAVGGGFCLGLLGLTRSVYALWLLPVSLLLAVLLWQDRISKERAKLALLLLVSAFLVQLPWWLRNGQLLHKPLSLGTQGDLNLYAAFGEAAYRHQGAWWNAVETDGRVAFVDELGRDCKECDEVELANYLSGGARRWVARHPLKTLQLAWWKIRGSWSHLPATGWIGGVLWLGMAAPFVLWRRRRALSAEAIAPVFLAIALTHLFIAATWSTGWRFLVPIEPLLILLSSVTLTALFFGEAAIGTFRDDPPRSPIC
jgi:4-amino-4-deoxy-L-arabinose transferase-like glycosyltransferase